MALIRSACRLLIAAALVVPSIAGADESRNSPYTASLIKGQEDCVHVWTLGVKSVGGGYDIAINPQKYLLLTSSFTGWNNHMMDMGKLIKYAEAMKRFGNTMVLWDLKSMKPLKIFSVPGAPLETTGTARTSRSSGA